jgi:hypothetical protein
MPNKKKTNLTPEAARILEQYRSAGNKSLPGNRDGETGADDTSAQNRPSGPPPTAAQRRSGTRGK